MAVFYNSGTLSPTYSQKVPKGQSAKSKAFQSPKASPNEFFTSKLVSGRFYTRYPILSPFTMLKVQGQPALSVYSFHAPNPTQNKEERDRQNELNALLGIASTDRKPGSVTLMGGDFNGSGPTLATNSQWKDCFKLSESQQKYCTQHGISGVTNTHNIRDSNWSLMGQFPEYNILNQALDQIMIYRDGTLIKEGTTKNYFPWIVNPVLGSMPMPSADLAQKGAFMLGYLLFPWTDQDLIEEVMKEQELTGIKSLLKENVYKWQALKSPWSDTNLASFNQIKAIQDSYYVSDHLPVAIDLLLPSS